jgi:hypothetical protein
MRVFARWCYEHSLVVITAWTGLLIGLAVMPQAVKASYDNSLTPAGPTGGCPLAGPPPAAPGHRTPAKEQPVRVPRSALV